MKGNRMESQGGKGRLPKEGSHMGQSLGREPRGSKRIQERGEGPRRGAGPGPGGLRSWRSWSLGSKAVWQERFDLVGLRSCGRLLNKGVA